jgi:hypothetical protein
LVPCGALWLPRAALLGRADGDAKALKARLEAYETYEGGGSAGVRRGGANINGGSSAAELHQLVEQTISTVGVISEARFEQIQQLLVSNVLVLLSTASIREHTFSLAAHLCTEHLLQSVYYP